MPSGRGRWLAAGADAREQQPRGTARRSDGDAAFSLIAIKVERKAVDRARERPGWSDRPAPEPNAKNITGSGRRVAVSIMPDGISRPYRAGETMDSASTPRDARSKNAPEDAMSTKRRALLVAAAATIAAPKTLLAQSEWRPSRPVQLLVPFAAGSGTDAISRIMASALEEAWGQRVVVDNRAGANGAIAAVATARAAPDGHTLMMTTNTPHGANPTLMRQLDYDPISDFSPIMKTGNYIFVFAVGETVPVTDLAGFLAMARARPGQVSYASGNGTGILAGATIARLGGVDLLHVPYRSTPPAMVDVIGGRVTGMVVDLSSAWANIRAGKLCPLGQTTRARSRLLPDLPSLHEAGLDGFNIISWAGLIGPARMPPEMVASINAVARRVWDRPETSARLDAIGFEAGVSGAVEFGRFIQDEITTWGQLARAAGIEPE
ncbi:MAG: transporter substrate-binding protein [Rhodospirillales bacterium]|nr:transporter substrate-binding protein [Rhodospirillales bacterium]